MILKKQMIFCLLLYISNIACSQLLKGRLVLNNSTKDLAVKNLEIYSAEQRVLVQHARLGTLYVEAVNAAPYNKKTFHKIPIVTCVINGVSIAADVHVRGILQVQVIDSYIGGNIIFDNYGPSGIVAQKGRTWIEGRVQNGHYYLQQDFKNYTKSAL